MNGGVEEALDPTLFTSSFTQTSESRLVIYSTDFTLPGVFIYLIRLKMYFVEHQEIFTTKDIMV